MRFLPASILLLCAGLVLVTEAVKFELPAMAAPGNRQCIWQFINKDTLVLAEAEIGQGYNQKIDIEVLDDSASNNRYFSKRDVGSNVKMTFTTHDYANVQFCFTNTLQDGFQPNAAYTRTINLHVDTGAEAMDYSQIAKDEKLKPIEVELRRLENVMESIVEEMEYLKRREMKMRDTNESTNSRVQWFSMLSMFALFASSAWQVTYLKRFFQSKKLI